MNIFLSALIAIIDYISQHLLKIKSCLRVTTRQIILTLVSLPSPFAICEDHCKRATKIIIDVAINVFFNNFQKQVKDNIRKDSIKGFKKRQRRKSE